MLFLIVLGCGLPLRAEAADPIPPMSPMGFAGLEGNAPDAWFGRSFAAGDLTGDGAADLVVLLGSDPSGGSLGGGLYGFAGPLSGALAFGDAAVRAVPLMGVRLSAFGVADLDGDGQDDLWFDSDSAGGAVVWGPLSGVVDLVAATPITARGCDLLALVEVDGDAAPELLTRCGEVADIVDGPTRAGGAGEALVALPDGGSPMGDLDGDGLTELGWTDVEAGTTTIAFGPFPATVEAAAASLTISLGPRGSRLVAPAGDLDRDGADDLVASDGVGAWVFTNLAPGTLAPADAAAVASEPLVPSAAGDLDGDGWPDLVGIGAGRRPGQREDCYPGLLWTSSGPLSGVFSPQERVRGSHCNAGLSRVLPVGDLDGDGDGDLAVAAQGWPGTYPAAGALQLFD